LHRIAVGCAHARLAIDPRCDQARAALLHRQSEQPFELVFFGRPIAIGYTGAASYRHQIGGFGARGLLPASDLVDTVIPNNERA
jgi:hypothetical protein